MKSFLKKSLVLLVLISTVLCAFGIGAFADDTVIRIECEDSYTSVKADGTTWAPKDPASTTFSIKEGSIGNGTGLVFNTVEDGNKVIFKVTAAEAGYYVLNFAYRDNQNYFADVQVKVNGEYVGGVFSTKGNTATSYSVTKELGVCALVKGENTVECVMVGTPAKFAFVPDCMTFTLDPDYVYYPNSKYEEIPEDAIIFESETTPFTTTDSTGKTTDVKGENAWAWSLDLNQNGIDVTTISDKLTYFRSGGINGTVDFTVNVEEAGTYDFMWAFRPHDASYCTVDVLINGEKIETVSQFNGDVVQGTRNQASIMRTIRCNGIDFLKGDNTVTFKMVAIRADEDMSKSGFTSDFIALVPAAKAPETPAELLTTDKDVYFVGEPIMVTPIGSGTDWIGIWQPGAETSVTWKYIDSANGGAGSGVETDIIEDKDDTIEPGVYVVGIIPDDMFLKDATNYEDYKVVAKKEIKIISNTPCTDVEGEYNIEFFDGTVIGTATFAGGKMTIAPNTAIADNTLAAGTYALYGTLNDGIFVFDEEGNYLPEVSVWLGWDGVSLSASLEGCMQMVQLVKPGTGGNEGGEGGELPGANELVLGANNINVVDGYNGDEYTFTAPADGNYTITAAEGESNHYIGILEANGNSWIDLPYTLNLKKGDTVTILVATNSGEADEINLVIETDAEIPETGDATLFIVLASVLSLGIAVVAMKRRQSVR